jgi:hypothetical protein
VSDGAAHLLCTLLKRATTLGLGGGKSEAAAEVEESLKEGWSKAFGGCFMPLAALLTAAVHKAGGEGMGGVSAQVGGAFFLIPSVFIRAFFFPKFRFVFRFTFHERYA